VKSRLRSRHRHNIHETDQKSVLVLKFSVSCSFYTLSLLWFYPILSCLGSNSNGERMRIDSLEQSLITREPTEEMDHISLIYPVLPCTRSEFQGRKDELRNQNLVELITLKNQMKKI
jgi:hypothetical protein